MTRDPFPLVDVIRRPRLDIANQFRRRDVWFQTKEHMGVIGHTIDRNQFLPFSCDNSSDVLLQLLASGRRNYARASGHREDNMQIDLRVRVGHFAGVNMTLLTELITFTFCGGYKHVAPTALTNRVADIPDRHPSADARLL